MPVVSVRWRIDAATPSAQVMSSWMMKSRRRVEGVAQPALAPTGVVGGEEREAWAGIDPEYSPSMGGGVKEIMSGQSYERR